MGRVALNGDQTESHLFLSAGPGIAVLMGTDVGETNAGEEIGELFADAEVEVNLGFGFSSPTDSGGFSLECRCNLGLTNVFSDPEHAAYSSSVRVTLGLFF